MLSAKTLATDYIDDDSINNVVDFLRNRIDYMTDHIAYQLGMENEITASEAAEYLEVPLTTFRRYVHSEKIDPTRVVGRNQFFATKDLKSFKRSLHTLKGS